jgi:hypothetical protein
MSKAEIASLHESDLVGRFNSSAQNMDIIETAAIYVALPETFNGDEQGRKAAWRDTIEENLRRMLQDNDNGQLPEGRIRHPAYEGLQFGPIEDVTSVRETNIVSGRNSHKPRRSFLEVCKAHSILSSANLKGDPVLDSSDSESGGFQDEYEDDGEEGDGNEGEEEEVYVLEGSSSKLTEGIKFQAATSYQTRDFVDDSFGEGEDEGEGEEGGEQEGYEGEDGEDVEGANDAEEEEGVGLDEQDGDNDESASDATDNDAVLPADEAEEGEAEHSYLDQVTHAEHTLDQAEQGGADAAADVDDGDRQEDHDREEYCLVEAVEGEEQAEDGEEGGRWRVDTDSHQESSAGEDGEGGEDDQEQDGLDGEVEAEEEAEEEVDQIGDGY